MKSILLGSNGYLGSNLQYYLKEKGFKNYNYSLKKHPKYDCTNYNKLDVTNKKDFKILDPDIDYIFFFTGITGTVESFYKYKKFIVVNQIGLINLLSWMIENKCKARVVFPSTRLVYKGNDQNTLSENSKKDTKTIYALSKLDAEKTLAMYTNAFNLKYTIFRICVPYGNIHKNNQSYGTIGFFIKQAMISKKISIYGKGLMRRTFSHTFDICNNIIHAISLRETINQTYNIGGENLNLLNAAKLIANKFNADIEFTKWPKFSKKIESFDTVFSSKKLDKICKYKRTYKFKDWVKNL